MEYLYCISRSEDNNKLSIDKFTIDTELNNQYTLDNGHVVDKSILNTHANNMVYAMNVELALIIMKKHTESQMIKAKELFISHGEFYDVICDEIEKGES